MFKLEEKRENAWVKSLTLLQDMTDAKDYIREHSLYNSSQKILLEMIQRREPDLWFLFDIVFEAGVLDEDVQVYIALKRDFTKYGKLCPAAEKVLPLNDCKALNRYGYQRFNAFRDYVLEHKVAVSVLGDFLAVLYKPNIARIKKISTVSEDYTIYQLTDFIASYPVNFGNDSDFNETVQGYNPTDIIEYVADIAYYGTTLLLYNERLALRQVAEGNNGTNHQVLIYDSRKHDEDRYYAKSNYEGLSFAEHFVYRLYSYVKQMVFADFNDSVYRVLLETYQKNQSQMVYLLLIEAMRKFGYTLPGVIREIGKDTEMSSENLNYFTGRNDGFYALSDLEVIELLRCPRDKILGYIKLRSRKKALGFIAERVLQDCDYQDQAVKAAYELKYGFESVKLFENEKFEELYRRCANLDYNDEIIKLYRPLFAEGFIERCSRMRKAMEVLAENDRIAAEEVRKQAEIEAQKKAEEQARLDMEAQEAAEYQNQENAKRERSGELTEENITEGDDWAEKQERECIARQKRNENIIKYCSVAAFVVIIVLFCCLF